MSLKFIPQEGFSPNHYDESSRDAYHQRVIDRGKKPGIGEKIQKYHLVAVGAFFVAAAVAGSRVLQLNNWGGTQNFTVQNTCVEGAVCSNDTDCPGGTCNTLGGISTNSGSGSCICPSKENPSCQSPVGNNRSWCVDNGGNPSLPNTPAVYQVNCKSSEAACTFYCENNYSYNSSKNSCDPILLPSSQTGEVCDGVLPTYAQLCPNNPAGRGQYYFDTSGCSKQNACAFVCESNYTWHTDTNTCDLNPTPTPSPSPTPNTGEVCSGKLPSNTELCPAIAGGSGNYHYEDTCSSLNPCIFYCKKGFLRDSVSQSCALISFSCQGTIASNSQLCSGDDQGLTTDTNRSLVQQCSDAKCEYTCKLGFHIDNGTCKQDSIPLVYHQYSCQTNGDWSNAGNMCTPDSSNSYSPGTSYSPNKVVCSTTAPNNNDCNLPITPETKYSSYTCSANGKRTAGVPCTIPNFSSSTSYMLGQQVCNINIPPSTSCNICGDSEKDSNESCDSGGGNNGTCPALCSSICKVNNCSTPIKKYSCNQAGACIEDALGTYSNRTCDNMCIIKNPNSCIVGTPDQICSTGLPGICSKGKQVCRSGTRGSCEANIRPGDQKESCSDKLDNDCDGLVDEGCSGSAGNTGSSASTGSAASTGSKPIPTVPQPIATKTNTGAISTGGSLGGGSSAGGSNYCGDGLQRSNEECDDGNYRNGDGCDTNCHDENGKKRGPSASNRLIVDAIKAMIINLKESCAYHDKNYRQILQKYKDIRGDDYRDPAVILTTFCITSGYKRKGKLTFDPDHYASVYETIKIISKIMAISAGIQFDEVNPDLPRVPYRDVKKGWFTDYVNYAHNAGLLTNIVKAKELKGFTPATTHQLEVMLLNAGKDTSAYDIFSKNRSIKRDDMATILIDIFKEKFIYAEYMMGENIKFYELVLKQLQGKSPQQQEEFLKTLMARMKARDKRVLETTLNIYLDGVLKFFDAILAMK